MIAAMPFVTKIAKFAPSANRIARFESPCPAISQPPVSLGHRSVAASWLMPGERQHAWLSYRVVAILVPKLQSARLGEIVTTLHPRAAPDRFDQRLDPHRIELHDDIVDQHCSKVSSFCVRACSLAFRVKQNLVETMNDAVDLNQSRALGFERLLELRRCRGSVAGIAGGWLLRRVIRVGHGHLLEEWTHRNAPSSSCTYVQKPTQSQCRKS